MKFRNMSVRLRIVLGFCIPIALFIGFVLFLAARLTETRASIAEVRDERIVVALLAKDLELDITQIQQFFTDVSATRGLDGLDDGWKLARANYDKARAGIAKFEQMYGARNDRRQLAALEQMGRRLDAFYQMGQSMAKAYVEGGPAQGNPLMPQFDKVSNDLQASLAPFVQQALDRMNGTVASASRQLDLIIKTAVGLSVLVVLLSVLASYAVTRSITRPLKQILASIEDLGRGDGDLTAQLPPMGGEFGRVSGALNLFIRSLHDMVSSIRVSSDTITRASGQLAAGNLDLSGRTEEQAGAIQRTVAAVEQFSGSVADNAGNARQASVLVASASGVALKGGQVVAQVVQTMSSINASSKKIVDIIGVIDSIAFQTNILALNAAVEAARAGEQGRGFAVVASEVRGLAQRSATAAKEIKLLIDASVREVTAGEALVAAAGQTMDEIVSSVASAAGIMQQIALACQEQETGIDDANRAIASMETGAQQNAALVKESASATGSLYREAENLSGQVGLFRLADGGVPAPARLALVTPRERP